MKKNGMVLTIALGALMSFGLMGAQKEFFKMDTNRFIKKRFIKKGLRVTWQELSDIIKENMEELGLPVPFEALVPEDLLDEVVPQVLIDSESDDE